MPCHKVETHFHTAFVSLVDQIYEVGIRTEARINLIKVDNIVTTVKPPRLKHRIKPQRIDAERLDII